MRVLPHDESAGSIDGFNWMAEEIIWEDGYHRRDETSSESPNARGVLPNILNLYLGQYIRLLSSAIRERLACASSNVRLMTSQSLLLAGLNCPMCRQ